MADGFSIHWFTEPWDQMQADLAYASDRATMYALRATGRALIRGARSRAPVYSGPDPRATTESGNLKKSIKNSRVIRRGGGVYEMYVMPAGSKKKGTAVTRHGKGKGQIRGVPLYRRKMEDMYHYMSGGGNDALAQLGEIYEQAYAKAFAKYAP